MQRAVGRPFGLADGHAIAAGDQGSRAQSAVIPHRRRPQEGFVPGHIGVVPGQPRQGAAVRAQAGRGHEVPAVGEHGLRADAVGRHGDDGVDDVGRVGVILPDANQPAGAGRGAVGAVQGGVGIAQGRRGGDGQRGGAGVLPVDALVVVVGEPHRAAAGEPGAAAVFVDAGAGVERRRVDIGNRAVGGGADDDIAAALGRPRLRPEDGFAVNGDAADGYRLGHDGAGGYRRTPGTVRRDDGVLLCQNAILRKRRAGRGSGPLCRRRPDPWASPAGIYSRRNIITPTRRRRNELCRPPRPAKFDKIRKDMLKIAWQLPHAPKGPIREVYPNERQRPGGRRRGQGQGKGRSSGPGG